MYRVTGLKQAIRAIKMQDKEIKRKLRDAFNSSAITIEREAKSSAPVNLGRLRSDVQKEIDTNKGGAVVSARVFNTLPYAPMVEFGTGPKSDVPAGVTFDKPKPSGSFDDMLDNIRQWCRNKGIPESFAYVIAVNILNNGLEPRPYLFPAFERERPNLLKNIEAIL
jgi:HK97 gp10 family phage protein